MQPDAMKVLLKVVTVVGFLLGAQMGAPVFAELNDIESEFGPLGSLGTDFGLLLCDAIFNSSALGPNTSETIVANTGTQPCLDAGSEGRETLALGGAKMRECMSVDDGRMQQYLEKHETSGQALKEDFMQTLQEDCNLTSARRIVDCYADTIASNLNRVRRGAYKFYSLQYWKSKFCIRSELERLLQNFKIVSNYRAQGLLPCTVLSPPGSTAPARDPEPSATNHPTNEISSDPPPSDSTDDLYRRPIEVQTAPQTNKGADNPSWWTRLVNWWKALW